MEKRAMIHFKREEFEECVIECEAILNLKDSSDITELKEKAKNSISHNKPWYNVLNVEKTASKSLVERAFRALAGVFHPNKAKNAKLSDVDKKKLNVKMAKVNRAKEEFKKRS